MNTQLKGFSIIELLVVVAIMSILLVLAVPAITSLLESTNITRGSQLVESQIQLAKQIASSKNCPVEIRLIKGGNLINGGFGAIQLWRIDPPAGTNPGTARAATKIEYLPSGICISEDTSQGSTLLMSCPATNVMPEGTALAGSNYAAFQIRPSGLVSPAANMNAFYVTIVSGRYGKAKSLPQNFSTLQINPLTGTPLIYRP